MVRTQITLTEEQHRRLARVARARGVSMSELVRQAVDATVADEDEEVRRKWERAKQVFGAFNSGIPDIAERHDDYLPDEW
jgi:hypothetical protein